MKFRREILILFFLSLLMSSANAQNKLKNFFKKLEDNIKQELREKIQPQPQPQPTQPQHHVDWAALRQPMSGTCTFARAGQAVKNEDCHRGYFCKSNRCYHAFEAPSGLRTVLELGANGRPIRYNGSALTIVRDDVYLCVKSTLDGSTFCFTGRDDAVVTKNPPKTKKQPTAEADTQYALGIGALPAPGIHYYSGYQQCGWQRRFLQARVGITNRGGVSILFAHREVEENGDPIKTGENSFAEHETWTDGRRRPLVFALKRNPKKMLAQGGFSNRGRVLAGRWHELDQYKQRICDDFELTRTNQPLDTYRAIEPIVAVQSPTSRDADRLVAFERTRPPSHWLAKNPRYVGSNRRNAFDRKFDAFWERYVTTGVHHIRQRSVNANSDYKSYYEAIDRFGALAIRWSRNPGPVFRAQYELVAEASRKRFEVGKNFYSFRDRQRQSECARMRARHGYSGKKELERKFGNPAFYWTSVGIAKFRQSLRQCKRIYDKNAAEFQNLEDLLKRHEPEIVKALENRDWLIEQAKAHNELPNTLETLIEVKGYALAEAELTQRGIGEALYKAAYVNQVSEAKRRSQSAAIGIANDRFSKESFSTLSPIKAEGVCYETLLKNSTKGSSSAAKFLTETCQRIAKEYVVRASTNEVDRLARTIKTKPASYQGLKSSNWFFLGQDVLDQIPEHSRKSMIDRYNRAVRDHYNKAVDIAIDEVRQAYSRAEPFSKSEDRVLNMCANSKWLAKRFGDACRSEDRKFSSYREEVRCVRALKGFRASDAMLDEYFMVLGGNQNAITFRDFVCRAASRRPDLHSKLMSSGIAFWKTHRIELRNNRDNLVFALELVERDIPDHRGFAEYLFDVASGRNDERVDTLWHGARVTKSEFQGSQYRSPSRSLACIYGFMKCQ